ncbi:MAG: S41 family peptidase [Blastocatellia bacterium]
MKTWRHTFTLISMLIVGLCLITPPPPKSALAQPDLNFQRDRGHAMLSIIKNDLKKNYYDPTFRGIDIEARFSAADAKMKEAASVGQIFGIIAQALLDLNDSHTFFLPPGRANPTEYGWQMQAFGDKVFVSAIKPGSDAEKKGLKTGDQILSVNGFEPSRAELWKMVYMFYTLRPQPGLRLVVQSPEGQQRQLDVMAKIKQGKLVTDLTGQDIWELVREAENEDRLNRQRYVEVGDKLLIWKMPNFAIDEGEVDGMMGKVRKRETLILDLRGNPGGYVKTLEWFAGYFFDKQIKIADLKGRKEMKPQMSKPHGDQNFKGKLIVLVDSKSGSAAEIFARIVQLEKRGVVIGDRTAGAVMQSRTFGHQMGTDIVIFYSASITNADVIMADGKSLEGVGVAPDELLLPTAADLAAKRDPALTRAAALAGFELPPDKAGAMFPIEWRK